MTALLLNYDYVQQIFYDKFLFLCFVGTMATSLQQQDIAGQQQANTQITWANEQMTECDFQNNQKDDWTFRSLNRDNMTSLYDTMT